jgi:hypothetical protein
VQKIIEENIASDRFNMKRLYNDVWSVFSVDGAISDYVEVLQAELGKDNYKKLGLGILRQVFLIELRQIPGTDSEKSDATKFRTRWYSHLDGDPRECSFEECVEIAEDLIRKLVDTWLADPEKLETLTLFLKHGILPYELPIDYLENPSQNDMVTRIHSKENIDWVISDNIVKTLKLRQYLTTARTSPDAVFFNKVIHDKIKTKTYLTDRVKTGLHKTNREKRWETDPYSVQFAFRRTCMAIEYKLVTQLCSFEGFPNSFKEMLETQGILSSELPIFRCPVTFEPMSFQEFQEKLINPTHGKSDFQVGHLHPLKLDVDDPINFAAGHKPENISWISEDGNRIQGDMSIEEIQSLLKRITRNYEDQNLI